MLLWLREDKKGWFSSIIATTFPFLCFENSDWVMTPILLLTWRIATDKVVGNWCAYYKRMHFYLLQSCIEPISGKQCEEHTAKYHLSCLQCKKHEINENILPFSRPTALKLALIRKGYAIFWWQRPLSIYVDAHSLRCDLHGHYYFKTSLIWL